MGTRMRAQCGGIRYLVNVAALVQRTQEVGLELIHREGTLLKTRSAAVGKTAFCSAFCTGLGTRVLVKCCACAGNTYSVPCGRLSLRFTRLIKECRVAVDRPKPRAILRALPRKTRFPRLSGG